MSSSPTGPAPPAVVQQHLSPPRLGTYVHACAGDLSAAVRLYRWNAAVSAALWEVLGHGEVILWGAQDENARIHGIDESVDLAELDRCVEQQVRFLQLLAGGIDTKGAGA